MIVKSIDDCDLILVVVPSDIGSTRRCGQAEGALLIYELVKELESDVKILDYGELFIDKFDLKKVHENVELEISKLKDYNKPLLLIGGDHSISYSAMNVFEKCQIISFDAHPDIVKDSVINHESFLREFMNRLSIKGVRNGSNQELEDLKRLRRIKSKEAYVSIDFDVLSPNIFPGVAYPEVDGWSLERLQNELKSIFSEYTIKCVDLVEFCPLIEKEKSLEVIRKLITFLLHNIFKGSDNTYT